MFLISIKLFLRSDEVVQMKFSDIVKDISIVRHDGFLECIAFEVLGKSDKVPVTLSLWADDILPKYCPIRHLLAYLVVAKVQSGYLFPGPGGGHIAYDTYHERFMRACRQLITRDGPFGTHSLLNTC